MSETSTTTAVPQGRRADGTPIRRRKPQPLTLARFGDCVLVGRGYDSAILSRRRITALLNRAIVLGEVEVGTFRLDESDLIAVKAFADGVTA